MVDPLFTCELALQLGLTVGEIQHGRGTPMSLHELTVVWPMYFAYQRREAAEAAQAQNTGRS